MNLDYIVENYRGEGLVATKEKVYDADEAARNESSHGKNTMKPVVEKYERIFKAIKDMLVNAGFKEGSAGYYSAFDYVLSKKAGVKLDSLNLKRFSNSEPRRASQDQPYGDMKEVERKWHEKFMRTDRKSTRLNSSHQITSYA